MNKVIITGELSQINNLNEFTSFTINTTRLSGYIDKINCRTLNKVDNLLENERYTVIGRIYSYNNDKSNLIIEVICDEIIKVENEEDKNEINLSGYICTNPNFRNTSIGKDACDFIIANNDELEQIYIPVVAWNRDARFTRNLKLGTNVELFGKMQSRQYLKKTKDSEIEKTAYEISTFKIFSKKYN